MFDIIFNIYTLAILAALIPVALLVYYIYRQDSEQPEPAKLLWKGGLYGILSALVVIFIFAPILAVLGLDNLGSTTFGAVFDAFCCAAIPEEAAKMFFLWLLLRNNKSFDEHLDGVVYATCVGLGFAGFENLLYLVDSLDSLVSVAVVRGLYSVPGHFFFAVAMGYFISIAHFGSLSPQEKKRNYLLAFLVPVMMHGIFDSLLMVSAINSYLSGFCMFAFFYLAHYMRKISISRIKELKERDAYVRYNNEFFNNGTTSE